MSILVIGQQFIVAQVITHFVKFIVNYYYKYILIKF